MREAQFLDPRKAFRFSACPLITAYGRSLFFSGSAGG